MNSLIRQIPNAITCLNVISGCVAIILCSGRIDTGEIPAWQWGALAVGVAAVADFLDGFAARLLHAYSSLGKELDSLCDLVSFGVAPVMITGAALADAGAPSWLQWAAVVTAVGGALRLARFNIDTRQSHVFIGLPVPANAIFWIGYSFLLAEGVDWLGSWPVFLCAALALAWLMLSPLKIFSLKFRTWGWRGNAARWLLVAGAAALVFCFGVGGLMWLILYYLALSQLPFAREE